MDQESNVWGSGSAITVTAVSYSGAANASGTYSEGPLSIAGGVLLTSGDAQLALPPDDGGATGVSNNLAGDSLCDALISGYTSYDASKLTIHFTLAEDFDGISFQSIFGSDEYPEYVNSAYNDVYGVYLDVCCPDGDADDVCDAADNCPGVANPDQANDDGDAA